MKILVTGGTGFIGSELLELLIKSGYEVSVLTHKRQYNGTGVSNISSLSHLPDNYEVDAIINLAGAPINKIWTDEYKTTLLDSRINTTKAIINLIKRLETKPKLLISASASGYYGQQYNAKVDEYSLPQDRSEFSHQLCALWEEEALKAQNLGVRVCIARFGVVLGKNGGFIKHMLPIFKIGLGSKIGSGERYLSWIHISDVLNILSFFLNNQRCEGVYNVSSPNPVTNKTFTKAMSKTLCRRAVLSIPDFIIKLFLREMGNSLLLNGVRVQPKRLLETNYRFLFNDIEDALIDIINAGR